MSKPEKSIEAMAEEIRGGNYADFGKLLRLCAYIPEEYIESAAKLGYEEEDVLQEAGIAFIHALHSYDKSKGAGFRTYASVCIKNHIASLLRSSKKNENSPMANYLSIDEIEVPSKTALEEDWIEKETFLDTQKRILTTLSPLEFEVLKLYLNGFSYKIIGEKLEKTEKAVSNALFRIRKKLRKALPEK